tara:strand:- start:1711 stop:2406 length:696 start_codon:yes stop_codon:yes gene_type:complete
MAENKKSFLIYSDTINNIEHLTNEEKGILFQHLLEYVNDMNPILEDRLILTAWKPIETHLKRDLKKWTDKAPQRSDKARKAGLASAKARELKGTKSNSLVENELNPTKSTVSVNVNVNDNVNDILLEKETKGKFNFKKDLIDLGFKDTLVDDWLIVRKNKKASNTKTSFKAIKNQIEKTKIDKDLILEMHVEKSWSGFKVEWYENESKKINNNNSNQDIPQDMLDKASKFD